MNIDYSIMSSDGNQMYLGFWESVSKVWNEKLGISPILLYVDNDYKEREISDKYGKVIRMGPISSIPLYVQAQAVRFWYATQLNDMVGIIADIDMYPLSKFYFKTQLSAIDSDKYVHLNPCIESYGHIPACYHVAKGRTFSKVLGVSNFLDYMNKLVGWSKGNNTKCMYKNKEYWFADEKYSTMCINNFNDKSIFTFIPRDGGQNGHRVDRISDDYFHPDIQMDKIKSGHYYDCHSIRPYDKHEGLIKLILENNNYG